MKTPSPKTYIGIGLIVGSLLGYYLFFYRENTSPVHIQAVHPMFENIDPDYDPHHTLQSTAAVCFYIRLSGTRLAAKDIQSLAMQTNGIKWKIRISENRYEEESRLIDTGLIYIREADALPLNGWTFDLYLSGGKSISATTNFSLPNGKSSEDAHSLITEDYEGKQGNYVPMLERARVESVYRTENTIGVEFFVRDKRVRNAYLWLFDESGIYLASSDSAVDTDTTNGKGRVNSDVLPRGRFDVNGARNRFLVSEESISSAGAAEFDLKQVDSVVVLLTDRSKENDLLSYHYRSRSERVALIPSGSEPKQRDRKHKGGGPPPPWLYEGNIRCAIRR